MADNSSSSLCQYIFKKGARKGQKCHAVYCRRHRKLSPTSSPISTSLLRLKKIYNDWLVRVSNKRRLRSSSSDDSRSYVKAEQLMIPKKLYSYTGIWMVGEKLGCGAFGVVYEGFSIQDQKRRAIKMEHVKSNNLEKEKDIYLKTNDLPIAHLIDFGIDGDIRFLVLEKLLPFQYHHTKVPDIIRGLEKFAQYNISHGDVKFENIMQTPNGAPVFIDLGLSFQINLSETKPKYDKERISGTVSYMSINAHQGVITYSNDVEALCYCLFDLAAPLPWDKKTLDKTTTKNSSTPIHTETIKAKQEFAEKVQRRDAEILDHFDLDPEEDALYELYDLIMNTKFHEKPDYEKMYSLTRKLRH